MPAAPVYHMSEYHGAPIQPNNGREIRAIIILFIQSLIVGVLAVFTPYVYTMHPFTVGYLTRDAKTGLEKKVNLFIYAGALLFVFAILGAVISLIVKFTGLTNYTEHWIYNFFCCRFFMAPLCRQDELISQLLSLTPQRTRWGSPSIAKAISASVISSGFLASR